MNLEPIGIEGLKLAISAACLFYAYWFAYTDAKLDAFRQDLFIIRNRLWDAAHKHECFSLPAYQSMRQLVNGAIRTAPGMNFFLIAPILAVDKRPVTSSISKQISKVDNAAFREILSQTHEQLVRRCLWYLFIQTLPGCIVGWPALMWVKFRGLCGVHRNLTTELMDQPMVKKAEFDARIALRLSRHLPTG